MTNTESGDDRFRWRRGSKPCLYGLSRLADARKAGFIVLCEGESDTHTLWPHDIPAAGLPGAANWREERDAPRLDGIDHIYVVVEGDHGGEAVKSWLAASRIRHRAKLVNLGAHKDPSGLYLDDPAAFKERFEGAKLAAIPWAAYEGHAASEQKNDAWTRCRDLALKPNILAAFDSKLEEIGLVEERRNAKLIYLALVSRLLPRPASVAVKGPSSGGKSFLVETVLGFFPDAAYYPLTAVSERALAYSDEPLQHRVLVLYEAAGMQGDFTTYLIRSLLSEGRIRYETVEKTAEGLRAKLIEREGPTGLLVTTTAARLHPENETRLLSLTVTDTQDQTRAILAALAADEERAVDLGEWRALQEWLALAGREVVVPCAKALAEKVPPVAVRLRRDFRTVLTLIKAHAILHQATRERDAKDRIVATLADYGVVRELVADMIAEGVEASVPETVAKAVDGVRDLIKEHAEGVPLSALAKHLAIDKSAASRRVRVAQDRGLLVNLEERKGRPARLKPGDAMPDQQTILPEREELGEDRCTVGERCNRPGNRSAASEPAEILAADGDRCTVDPLSGLNHSSPPSRDSDLQEPDDWLGQLRDMDLASSAPNAGDEADGPIMEEWEL